MYSDYEMMRLYNPYYFKYVKDKLNNKITDLRYSSLPKVNYEDIHGIKRQNRSVETIVIDIDGLHRRLARLERNLRKNRRIFNICTKGLSHDELELINLYFIEQSKCEFNGALLGLNKYNSHNTMFLLKRTLYEYNMSLVEQKEQHEKALEKKKELERQEREQKKREQQRKKNRALIREYAKQINGHL